MKYKGYQASISFDESVDRYHGRVIDLRDVINFQGASVDELAEAFHDAVDDYLDFCAKLAE